jgi:hypothetical protein
MNSRRFYCYEIADGTDAQPSICDIGYTDSLVRVTVSISGAAMLSSGFEVGTPEALQHARSAVCHGKESGNPLAVRLLGGYVETYLPGLASRVVIEAMASCDNPHVPPRAA